MNEKPMSVDELFCYLEIRYGEKHPDVVRLHELHIEAIDHNLRRERRAEIERQYIEQKFKEIKEVEERQC